MRQLYSSLLMVLCAMPVRAQDPAIRITGRMLDSASTVGHGWIALNQGWRVHAGDDPAWAGVAFDDRAWNRINSDRPLSKQLLDQATAAEEAGRHGIVWFRLHLSVDSSAALPLYTWFDQYATNEIYVNGVLIRAYGNVLAPADTANAPLESAPIAFNMPAGDVVIAIRQNVAVQAELKQGVPFGIQIQNHAGLNTHIRDERFSLLQFVTMGGLLLALGLLHLMLFAVLPRQRANLFFALFALVLGAALESIILPATMTTLRLKMIVHQIGSFAVIWAFVPMIAFMYATFGVRMPRRITRIYLPILAFVTAVGLSSIEIPGAVHIPRVVWQVMAIVLVLTMPLEALWLMVVGLRRRLPGARLIGASAAPFFILFGLALVPRLQIPDWVAMASILAIPIAASAYLVRNIAHTSRDLEKLTLNLKDEVAAQTVELRDARVVADDANRAKSQFLANMSHELRTPLNAIIGYSEMLVEEARDLKQDTMATDLVRVHTSGKHLLGLINDVLDLSKVEAGHMEIVLDDFAVEQIITDVGATIQPLLIHNRNTLETHVSLDAGRMVADEVKVRQILFNLLSNASKFTSDGTVRLTAVRDGDDVIFSVADSGVGMTAAQTAKLFQPFSQAETTTSRKYGGTGLGLAISKRFAELMGGGIDVTSAIGVGTTFTVRLPAAAEEIATA